MSSPKTECVACKSVGKMCNQDCVFAQFFGTEEHPDYKILDTAYGIKDVIQIVNMISNIENQKITLKWLLEQAKKGVRCKLFSYPLVMCSNDLVGPREVPVSMLHCSWIMAGLCISLGWPTLRVFPAYQYHPVTLQQIPLGSSSANPYFIGNPQLLLQRPPTPPWQHLQYGQQQLPLTPQHQYVNAQTREQNEQQNEIHEASSSRRRTQRPRTPRQLTVNKSSLK